MNIRTLIKTLPVIAAALALAACSTVKFDRAGQHTAVYQFRTLTGLVNGNNMAAYNAATQAVHQLDLYTVTTKKEQFSSEIIARAQGDKKVSIDIKEINSLQTQIEIVWGGAGSKDQSTALYEAITKNMGK